MVQYTQITIKIRPDKVVKPRSAIGYEPSESIVDFLSFRLRQICCSMAFSKLASTFPMIDLMIHSNFLDRNLIFVLQTSKFLL